ncbi:MAG: hypothetical protein RIR97_909 [Pseudomonadota bacterium]
MYRGRLERDLTIWVRNGLLEDSVAKSLLAELDRRESKFSVGNVFSILAAALLSCAILLFIASNWEAIPRLLRLSGILVAIWAFFLAAAWAQPKKRMFLAESLLILGSASFGGAIAVVGQMYHLSGDAAQAELLWLACVVPAAALFRSKALTFVSGLLSWMVFAAYLSLSFSVLDSSLPWLVPVMAMLVIALVYWTGADKARHFAYLSLIALIVMIHFENHNLSVPIAMVIGGLAAFATATLEQSTLRNFAQNAGPVPVTYAFAIAVLGLFLIHLETLTILETVCVFVVTVGACLAGLFLSGRDNGAVRYLAYLTFASECLYLSYETIGSMMGTSIFFLGSGLIVALIAWMIVRLEKRFSHAEPVTGENG